MAYIFSGEDWLKMYSNEVATATPKHFKDHPLHYLLGQAKEEQFIVNFIGMNSLKPLLYKCDEANHGLTPLIIATMRKMDGVVQALLEDIKSSKQPKLLNKSDRYGWTAMHHATLCRPSLVKLFKEYGADIKVLTHLNGNLEDFRKISELTPASPSMDHVFIEENGALQKIRSLTPARLKEMTGLQHYRYGIYVPKEMYKQYWMTQFPDITANLGGWYGETLIPKYPDVCLKHSEKTGWGLVAKKVIKQAVIISEYGGELFDDDLEIRDTSYVLNSIDTQKKGNLARWTNWGFPNCTVRPCPSKGYMQGFLVALEDIPEGAPLLWDYGLGHTHAFEEPLQLLDREGMHNYFKQNSISKCLEKMDVLKRGAQLEKKSAEARIKD